MSVKQNHDSRHIRVEMARIFHLNRFIFSNFNMISIEMLSFCSSSLIQLKLSFKKLFKKKFSVIFLEFFGLPITRLLSRDITNFREA